MKEPILVIIIALLMTVFIYGSYWVAKNVSYSLCDEDMVKETIVEMVKSNSLVK